MVREDGYLRLRAAEEDLEDVRLYDEAKAKPPEIPSVLARISGGRKCGAAIVKRVFG